MVVKSPWGFAIDCVCADRDPRRGRGRKPDKGNTLGSVILNGEDGRAFMVPPPRIGMVNSDRYITRVEVFEDGSHELQEFRVTCNQCGRAWVFTVTELTERHDEMARREPPVGVAGVDVGHPVGQT